MNAKINTLLHLLWAAAVAFLLFVHFSRSQAGPSADSASPASAPDAPKIVFVNADTLLNNYEYMNQKQEEFAKREEKADAELKARGRALEREFAAAQEKVQKGLLAPNQVAAEEQRLMQKQQALMADQERITKQLLEEGKQLQEELNKAIKDLLADIRREKGYDYILSYGPGTGVLMVNDSLDITQMVLERLNKKEEKKVN